MARDTEPDRPQIRLDGNTIRLAGNWTSVTLVRALAQIPRKIPPRGVLTIDLAGVRTLDIAGAWFIERSVRNLRHDGREVAFANLGTNARSLLELVAEQVDPREAKPVRTRFTLLQRTGHATLVLGEVFRNYLAFIGQTAERWVQTVGNPRRWRIPQFLTIVEETGVTAVPIVALLSFLIGVVITYEGLFVLRSFGASLFVVNIASVTVLRELAPLIAAIVVAGRTGSAFAAQIGTMKVSEEVDAMVAMGLSPIEVLALPRIFGLMLALPLLTVLADIAGLIGALFIASVVSGITPHAFVSQLVQEAKPATVLAGIAKAPVFAIVIATVGCFHGFKAESSAESVGQRTTRSVVQSIFFVIVIDAVFAVAYSTLGI